MVLLVLLETSSHKTISDLLLLFIVVLICYAELNFVVLGHLVVLVTK